MEPDYYDTSCSTCRRDFFVCQVDDLLNSSAAFDKLLINRDLNKSKTELFVRSDEDVLRRGRAKWIIKLPDIRKLKTSKQCLKSSNIKIGSPSYCSFNIEAYPTGKIQENEPFLSIYVRFPYEFPENEIVQAEIDIVDENGVILKSEAFVRRGNDMKVMKLEDFIRNSDLQRCVRDDKLIIQCSMKIHSTKYKCSSDRVVYDVAETEAISCMKETIADYEPVLYSDVTLEVGEKQIKSHKCLLASDVPFFRKLFKLEDRDKYELKNTNYTEFKDMLHYVYTGNMSILNFRHACKLYIMADMYEVQNLKDICLSYISCNLSKDNVLVAQLIAEDYSDEILKKACIDFICKNNC